MIREDRPRRFSGERQLRVAVGSLSRYKIDAVEAAFRLIYPDAIGGLDVAGVGASSGVSAQPVSNDECLLGARNRASRALASSGADFGVGLENGLVEIESMWFATTWIVIRDAYGVEGVASTLLRPVPERIMARVQRGLELSDAIRVELGSSGSSGNNGFIDILTNGILQRNEILRDGVITAMSVHLNPDLFDQDGD